MLQTLVRTLAAYASPPHALSTYYASRQPGEAWFTAFAEPVGADDVRDRIEGHFPGVFSTSDTDAILGEDLRWYRLRLQHVTDIALAIPDDPHLAAHRVLALALNGLPDPAVLPALQARPDMYEDRLERPLSQLATAALAVAATSDETGVPFWTDFLRWPHRNTDSLSPAGHWLWNLAL